MLCTGGPGDENDYSIVAEDDGFSINVQSMVVKDELSPTPDTHEEDQLLPTPEEQEKDEQMKPDKAEQAKMTFEPVTKVLFFDGVRGLASILVVVEHSRDYMTGSNAGTVGVDMFFVLSSFLLTWLFTKKSIRMLDNGAGVRPWIFTLADYFSRRFFRVYPLFAITCIVLWFLDDKARKIYFLDEKSPAYDLFKTLTFEFDYRYFVFWTLPIEMLYYIFIPLFVLGTLLFRKWWWVPYIPVYYWVISEGINKDRTFRTGFRPHFPTLLAGSMAAVLFVKLDTWIKASGFQFRFFHRLILRTIEFLALAVFLSLLFRGLFFIWVHENPVPKTSGFPFVSVLLTIMFVCEMLLPSELSSMLEWNILRYWGKISFSVYLLHGFVVYTVRISSQSDYYCKLFSRFGLICMLATTSYHLIEYPFQLFAQRITKALIEQETKGSGGLTVLLGKWVNPWKGRLGRCAEGRATR